MDFSKLATIVFFAILCAPFVARAQTQRVKELNTPNNSLDISLQWQNSYREVSRMNYQQQHDVNLTESCSGEKSCPPWFYPIRDKDGDCKCKCDDKNWAIKCDDSLQTSAILDCYCVTHDEKHNTTVAGPCFYNCENVDKKGYDMVYHPLPKTLEDLNQVMCGQFNRTGRLCGNCMNGTFPLAYSYDLHCVECEDGHKNWWKIIVPEFLSLTVFCFIVLFFKINATSSHMHGYVFFSQALSMPVFIRTVLPTFQKTPQKLKIAKVISFFYSIWNLDFFRIILPGVCLRATLLQILTLDYAIALYPLVLMFVSYLMIELHERNFKIVVLLWKPFRFVFTFFRRNWDSRTSVIDAYATFFVLSFMKFLSVSFDILTPAHLHHLNSTNVTLVLYYAGTIDYFGKDHLPYAILAIMVLIFFIAVPLTVLLLYPFKFFQKFLGCFPIRWHFLHTFADSFLGCYKDGTECGTRDCRYFAVLFFAMRILSFLIYANTVSSAYFEAAIVLWSVFIILIVTVQPFKEAVNHNTKINAFYILLLVVIYASIAGMDVAGIKDTQFMTTFIILTFMFAVIPILSISFVSIRWLYIQRTWGKDFIARIRAWREGYDWWTLMEPDGCPMYDEDSLPDRLVHPDQYHDRNLSLFNSLSTSITDSSSSTATY